MNERQRLVFADLAGKTRAERMSLANSAGIALGDGYAFDLTRPGLALYGGIPRVELAGQINPVVHLESQILQRRIVKAGESVGYNAIWSAMVDTPVAIMNLGYADGFPRSLSHVGSSTSGVLSVLGRVSMDLVALQCTPDSTSEEGDWVELDFNLATVAEQSGRSPYELLTSLGQRFERGWSSLRR